MQVLFQVLAEKAVVSGELLELQVLEVLGQHLGDRSDLFAAVACASE